MQPAGAFYQFRQIIRTRLCWASDASWRLPRLPDFLRDIGDEPWHIPRPIAEYEPGLFAVARDRRIRLRLLRSSGSRPPHEAPSPWDEGAEPQLTCFSTLRCIFHGESKLKLMTRSIRWQPLDYAGVFDHVPDRSQRTFGQAGGAQGDPADVVVFHGGGYFRRDGAASQLGVIEEVHG